MYGFTFDGTHSSAFRAFAANVKKPLLAQQRDYYEYIPGRDNTLVFTQGFEDKKITLQLVVRDDRQDKIDALRRVASWLYRKDKKRLIFDDAPDVFYLAKISDVVEVDSKMHHSVLSITFTAEPLLQAVELESVTTNNNEPIVVNNKGMYDALPVFRVTVISKMTELKLTQSGNVLTFKGDVAAGATLVIDTENVEVYTQAGGVKTDKSAHTEGVFPTLFAGTNQIDVAMQGAGTIRTEWRRRYL